MKSYNQFVGEAYFSRQNINEAWPLVSAGIGALNLLVRGSAGIEAIDRAQKGDYTGAALSAGQAFLPGGKYWAALAADQARSGYLKDLPGMDVVRRKASEIKPQVTGFIRKHGPTVGINLPPKTTGAADQNKKQRIGRTGAVDSTTGLPTYENYEFHLYNRKNLNEVLAQRGDKWYDVEFKDGKKIEIEVAPKPEAIERYNKLKEKKLKEKQQQQQQDPPKDPPKDPPAPDAPTPPAPVLSKLDGVEGTGVGKDFKAKAFTDAERSRYNERRGAEQLAKDVIAVAASKKAREKAASESEAKPKNESYLLEVQSAILSFSYLMLKEGYSVNEIVNLFNEGSLGIEDVYEILKQYDKSALVEGINKDDNYFYEQLEEINNVFFLRDLEYQI